jgi:hypothetical protein
MNTAFDLKESYSGDWLFYDFVQDCTHHVRQPNGESDQSYPAHVVFDNEIAGEFQQIAQGLMLSDDTQLARLWRDSVEHPAPVVNDLLEVVVDDEPRFHTIDRIEHDRMGRYLIATTLIREDVE